MIKKIDKNVSYLIPKINEMIDKINLLEEVVLSINKVQTEILKIQDKLMKSQDMNSVIQDKLMKSQIQDTELSQEEKRILEKIENRKKDINWIENNSQSIKIQYKDKIIAVKDKKVVQSGSTYKELKDNLYKRDIKIKECVIEAISDSESNSL